MPTYEYACKKCAEHLEVVQSFSDDPLEKCPACGGQLRKVFGNVGIVFKGSGFYKTDSRPKGKSESGSGSSSAAASASSSSESSSDKGDAKGDSKSDKTGGKTDTKSADSSKSDTKKSDTKKSESTAAAS
jgi:putative FmdB family regulatory protein